MNLNCYVTYLVIRMSWYRIDLFSFVKIKHWHMLELWYTSGSTCWTSLKFPSLLLSIAATILLVHRNTTWVKEYQFRCVRTHSIPSLNTMQSNVGILYLLGSHPAHAELCSYICRRTKHHLRAFEVISDSFQYVRKCPLIPVFLFVYCMVF